jgi:hypothetical protein
VGEFVSDWIGHKPMETISTDIRNTGRNWVDKEVVTDRGLVTSRNPKDLPAFLRQDRRGVRRRSAPGTGPERLSNTIGRRFQSEAIHLETNKKGRGEIAPTFLTVALHPCQYIRGQKQEATPALRATVYSSAHQQCR